MVGGAAAAVASPLSDGKVLPPVFVISLAWLVPSLETQNGRVKLKSDITRFMELLPKDGFDVRSLRDDAALTHQ